MGAWNIFLLVSFITDISDTQLSKRRRVIVSACDEKRDKVLLKSHQAGIMDVSIRLSEDCFT